jgi:anti-sigma factor RsiW
MTWKDRWGRIARRQPDRGARSEPGGAGLTCQELVELVTDYLEGALSPDDRHRFETHLEGCAGCRAYLEQTRGTILAVGGVAAPDLDPVMRERLVDAFRDWRSGREA